MSPKNQCELKSIADDLSIELLKIQKVFEVRWAFSSFVAIRSVLRDYPALFQHFCACADNPDKTSKEKRKYRGLDKKLQAWVFVSETCIMKDGLRCLKQLSLLYLQHDESNIVDAFDQTDILKTKLLSLKVENGQTLKKFWANFENDSCYKGVEVCKNDADDEKFNSFRSQFFQALCDNVTRRFPCTDTLSAASVFVIN